MGQGGRDDQEEGGGDGANGGGDGAGLRFQHQGGNCCSPKFGLPPGIWSTSPAANSLPKKDQEWKPLSKKDQEWSSPLPKQPQGDVCHGGCHVLSKKDQKRGSLLRDVLGLGCLGLVYSYE